MDDCYLQNHHMAADERHSLILEYLQYVYEDTGTCDILMVVQRAGENVGKLGGISYLMQLRDSTPSANNFHHYQKMVRDDYIQRTAQRTFQSMALDGNSGKIDLNNAQAKIEELQELSKDKDSAGLIKMAKVLENHEEEIKQRRNKRGLTGAKTISPEVDRFTGGHQRGDMEIVAARPSMGKTAYMNCDVLSTTRAGNVAAIFSAEMEKSKITERMLCAMALIDNTKLRTGAFDNDDWLAWSFALDELDRLRIFIDDTPGMSVQHIWNETKKLVNTHPGSHIVVYVDYLQLIDSGRKLDKREGSSYVSRRLKLMARTFGVTVVALAQLSRKVEERQDKRPMMSDIKESGDIEQDGDIITFLYRDDYYDKESPKKGIVELIFAKGRNIGTGTVEMVFLKNFGKFTDLDRSHHGKANTG
jgi:replicative DNA helicase